MLVYLLGGISRRFGGGIKALATVGPQQEPLLEISLQQALPSGFSKIVFIVSPTTQQAIKNRFGYSYRGIPIFYAVQTYDLAARDKPWGTADALCSAIPFLKTPFIICNGDDLYGATSFGKAKQALISSYDHVIIGYQLGSVLTSEGSVNRGILLSNEKNEMKGMREEMGLMRENLSERGLSPGSLCSMNLFGMQSSLLPFLAQYVKDFKHVHLGNRMKECLLPEFVNEVIAMKKGTFNVLSTTEPWIGITYAEDVSRVRALLASLS